MPLPVGGEGHEPTSHAHPQETAGEHGTLSPVAFYRVTFRTPDAAAGEVLMRFDDSGPRVAVAESLPPESFVKRAYIHPHGGEMFLLLVSKSAPDAARWKSDAEAWMALDEPHGFGPAYRVGIESGSLLWRPGRAFVLAPQRSGEEALSFLKAVTEFTFYHGELCRLEAELAGQWQLLQQDLPLAAGSKGISQAPRVAEMTAAVLERRIQAARIEPRLLRPWADLPPGPRQAGARLRSLAKIEERLERLDEQMQVYERSYATINQRLSDTRHSRAAMWIVILILALLTVGTLLLTSDFYLFHFGPE